MSDNASKITLVIPTLNRPDFIVRLIRYYHDLRFTGRLLIGDSSTPENLVNTKKEIERVKGDLNIDYVELPGLECNPTFQQLMNRVETPYVAYLGDDDFIIPDGIKQCIAFLEQHHDYSAAHGEARAFTTESDGADSEQKIIGPYKTRSIEHDTAEERLNWHLFDYSVTIFAVHRVETWRKMWDRVGEVEDRSFGGEIIPCCMSVVAGKIKKLKCLYLLRQSHENIYYLPKFIDWVATASWASSFAILVDQLATEMEVVDNISKEEAERIVKDAFANYLFVDQGTLKYMYRKFRGVIGFKIYRMKKYLQHRHPALASFLLFVAPPICRIMGVLNVIKHGHNYIISAGKSFRLLKIKLSDAFSNNDKNA